MVYFAENQRRRRTAALYHAVTPMRRRAAPQAWWQPTVLRRSDNAYRFKYRRGCKRDIAACNISAMSRQLNSFTSRLICMILNKTSRVISWRYVGHTSAFYSVASTPPHFCRSHAAEIIGSGIIVGLCDFRHLLYIWRRAYAAQNQLSTLRNLDRL